MQLQVGLVCSHAGALSYGSRSLYKPCRTPPRSPLPQHMSVPQLIDTILINPTVHVSPSYRDTGARSIYFMFRGIHLNAAAAQPQCGQCTAIQPQCSSSVG